MLIYLSLEERRAEIVADRAIAEKVEPEVWGEAMAVLVDEVKRRLPVWKRQVFTDGTDEWVACP